MRCPYRSLGPLPAGIHFLFLPTPRCCSGCPAPSRPCWGSSSLLFRWLSCHPWSSRCTLCSQFTHDPRIGDGGVSHGWTEFPLARLVLPSAMGLEMRVGVESQRKLFTHLIPYACRHKEDEDRGDRQCRLLRWDGSIDAGCSALPWLWRRSRDASHRSLSLLPAPRHLYASARSRCSQGQRDAWCTCWLGA